MTMTEQLDGTKLQQLQQLQRMTITDDTEEEILSAIAELEEELEEFVPLFGGKMLRVIPIGQNQFGTMQYRTRDGKQVWEKSINRWIRVR